MTTILLRHFLQAPSHIPPMFKSTKILVKLVKVNFEIHCWGYVLTNIILEFQILA